MRVAHGLRTGGASWSNDRMTGVRPIRSGFWTVMLVAATGLGLYLCWLMAMPFLPAIVFSVTLAMLSTPLDRVLRRRFRSTGIAAAVTTVLVAFVIVIPLLVVLAVLLSEAVRGSDAIGSMIDAGIIDHVRAAHPALAPVVEWLNERVDIPEILRTGSGAIAAWGGSVLRGSLEGVVNLLLTFYFLFYLLRDREKALTAAADLSPLTRDEFDLLATRIDGTIHATVYGTIAVAALQGLLGGLMFWWLGLPAPVLWGVLMGALAVIPFLGAFVIWAPVAVYLALSGAYASAILLAAWGTVVVGLVDNVVFPMLVGWRMMMHTVLSFIAIAGGLFVFGTPGVILGPVATTTCLVLLGLWRQRYPRRPPAGQPDAAPRRAPTP